MKVCRACNDEGFYENFAGVVEYHMEEPWFNVRDLVRVLKRIQTLDLAKPEERHKALCWLNGLDCRAPYSEHCRFPVKEFYVTEARGCWKKSLALLKKRLADNCMIQFEVGKPAPKCKKKKKDKEVCREDCEGNTNYCEDCGQIVEPNIFTGRGPVDNRCPVNSEFCNQCRGPEPPSCCPPWCGKCEVRRVRPASYNCYLKNFTDLITKMLRELERKDCVITRKSFEKYYKLIWRRLKDNCNLLDDDSDEFICEDCRIEDRVCYYPSCYYQ